MSQAAYPHLDVLPSGTGVLVVGHGTRSADGQRQLLELTLAMQRLSPSTQFEPAFLELAEPDIAAGLGQFIERGISQVFVVPILLFSAAHDREDIPLAVAEASQKLGIRVLGQSTPLGEQSAALALSQLRCFQSMMCTNPAGCDLAGACAVADACCGPMLARQADDWLHRLQSLFADTNLGANRSSQCGSELEPLAERLRNSALVLIGRGTSQLPARRAMERLMETRLRQFPVAWSTIGFFAGDDRSIDVALDLAAEQAASDTVIVQPHLLFEGVLSEQLRQAVEARRSRGKRWLVASPLGGDQSLAHTWLRMADERLAKLA